MQQIYNVINCPLFTGAPFHDEAFIGNSEGTYNINPLQEIIKLHEEKIGLFERMLKEKDEMMVRLEKLISK